MKHELVLASGNSHKVKEIQNLLNPFDFSIRDLSDFPGHPPLIEEGKTFLENAHIKAKIMAKFTNCLTLADDSGLEVEALNGAPGIYSARYANMDTGKCDDRANNEKLLKELEKIPECKRKARYCSVLVLMDPKTNCGWNFDGFCHGYINFKPKGSGGFGYDPLFYLPKRKCTMAEISFEEKNQISHRAKALKKLIQALPNILKEIANHP